jgi:predicted nucleic-acid-binding Zn-ribbon protein
MSQPGASAWLKPCPTCGSDELYANRISSAGSRHGIRLLPGLGSFLHYAELNVVLCANCGLTRFFAEPSACEKVKSAPEWKRL